MSTTEALQRRQIIDLGKQVGLIGWVSDDYEYFTFAGEEVGSEQLIAFAHAALAAAAPSPAAEPMAVEEVRMVYKTGYDEGYSDASGGDVDHDACEEGWQQYLAAQHTEGDDHE